MLAVKAASATAPAVTAVVVAPRANVARHSADATTAPILSSSAVIANPSAKVMRRAPDNCSVINVPRRSLLLGQRSLPCGRSSKPVDTGSKYAFPRENIGYPTAGRRWTEILRKDRPVGFPEQQQQVPGIQAQMDPVPDCGEQTYRGSGKLTGKKAVITGGDSGIGRAAAIAFAREGADVLVSYLNEHDDAQEVARLVEESGRKCVLVAGDLSDPDHCREVIRRAVDEFGRIDVLVNNAAYQMTHDSLDEIPDEEWDYTFRLNVGAYFYLLKAAVPHMPPGSSVIGSSSVNSDMPSPTLAPYAATKAAIANFSASMAQLLGEKGIRVNSVAPGPIWTPLIPATMPSEKVQSFGDDTPLGRAGQPVELAPVYVLLASDEGSYISGARVAVTGGRPIL
jgi:NAD(P)-dependent dehydrogenase (short-subunit alcohol dehydrogenase family)